MAHYDCSNCGESLGIGFGKCLACTPLEVFEAETQLRNAHLEAEAEWNAAVRQLRDEFLVRRTAAARANYQATWNRHAPERLKRP